MADIDHDAQLAKKFDELSPETKQFLSELDKRDIATLRDGLELVRSTLTVGRFMRWLIIGVVGAFFGVVMLWESVLKFVKLIGGGQQ